MITIITGEVDSGKTTLLFSLYNENKVGDGFVLKKVYCNGQKIGQNIVHLATGIETAFSRIGTPLPPEWNEKYRYDVYSFSHEGLALAEDVINTALQNKMSPIFIDEIGPLELQGKGFYYLFSSLLSKSSKVYCTVRKDCLKETIQKFNLSCYEILQSKK